MLIVPLLLIGTFVSLFPLLLYCLYFAGMNNRPRPTFVSGSWDFASVILATSGFWILGGPAILVGFHEQWRRVLMRGSFANIRDYLHFTTWPWGILWAVYFVAVTAGAAWLLWRRRSAALVYNIDPNLAHPAVEATFGRIGTQWSRLGDAYSFSAPPTPPSGEGASSALGPIPGLGVLTVSVAPGLRTLTLRWFSSDRRLREQFESDLQAVLAGVESRENPLVARLMTIATVLFAIMLFCVALFVLFVWTARG